MTFGVREGVHSQQIQFQNYELCKKAEEQLNQSSFTRAICLQVKERE